MKHRRIYATTGYINEVWNAKDKTEFRDKLESLSHEILGEKFTGSFFGVVRDVANTSKHVTIGRPDRQVNSIEDVRESISIVRFEDDEGYYYSYLPTVVVVHVDGHRIPIEVYLYLCFLAFTSILVTLEVIPCAPELSPIKREFYKSRNQASLEAPAVKSARNEPVNLIVCGFVYREHKYCTLRALEEGDEFSYKLDYKWIVEESVFAETSWMS